MKAYSHSTAHYDRKGQCRYEYGPGRLVVERKPEPEPEVVAPPPVVMTPIPFAHSLDGLSIVFQSPKKRSVTVPLTMGGRLLDLEHPEALATKTRPDRTHRIVVRITCPVCDDNKHLHLSEWMLARGCKGCANKRVKLEHGGIAKTRPGDILPFATMGRRGR
jgi:hypothetical protein